VSDLSPLGFPERDDSPTNQVIERRIINQTLYRFALQTNGLDSDYDGSMTVI
jgi:hypothetical protein